MPPQQSNQYDFIMNPNQQRGGGPAFLQNPKNKIIVSVLFVSTILIVVIILFNVFTSLGKQSNDDMVSVVAWQTEIIRISQLGLKEARDPNTRTQLSTLNSFLQSDASATQSYLSSSGVKLKPEQLASQQDSTVTADLESATQLNKYDETLIAIIEEKTASYKASLRSALNATSTTNRKTVLDTAATNILTYEGAEL